MGYWERCIEMQEYRGFDRHGQEVLMASKAKNGPQFYKYDEKIDEKTGELSGQYYSCQILEHDVDDKRSRIVPIVVDSDGSVTKRLPGEIVETSDIVFLPCDKNCAFKKCENGHLERGTIESIFCLKCN